MTITLGWWMLPTALSLALMIYTVLPSKSTYAHGADAIEAIVLLTGMVVVLAAWLIWALLK